MTAIGNAIYAVAVALGIAQLVLFAILVAAMALTARRRRPRCALCLREFGPRETIMIRVAEPDVLYCEPCVIARCEARVFYAHEKRRGQ